jgi:hypothetical protein
LPQNDCVNKQSSQEKSDKNDESSIKTCSHLLDNYRAQLITTNLTKSKSNKRLFEVQKRDDDPFFYFALDQKTIKEPQMPLEEGSSEQMSLDAHLKSLRDKKMIDDTIGWNELHDLVVQGKLDLDFFSDEIQTLIRQKIEWLVDTELNKLRQQLLDLSLNPKQGEQLWLGFGQVRASRGPNVINTPLFEIPIEIWHDHKRIVVRPKLGFGARMNAEVLAPLKGSHQRALMQVRGHTT